MDKMKGILEVGEKPIEIPIVLMDGTKGSLIIKFRPAGTQPNLG